MTHDPRGFMGQQRPPPPPRVVRWYKCGQTGHYADKCTQNQLPPPPPLPNSQAMVRAPPPKAFNTNNRPIGRAARVNHVKVDKAEEAPDVVLGTLPVNSIPAKVLFRSIAFFRVKGFCYNKQVTFNFFGKSNHSPLPRKPSVDFQNQSWKSNSNWRSLIPCFSHTAWQFRH